MSVSFTDGSGIPAAFSPREGKTPPGYYTDATVLGRVWIPEEGLLLTPPVRIRYEKHPWMEKFEFDGIRTIAPKRKGIGTKNAKGFVRSLNTIYSDAYDDYFAYGGDEAFDAEGYFAHAAERFADLAESGRADKMVRKFCGFAENMWREGDAEMLAVCMETVVPQILASALLRRIFEANITEEFREYLKSNKSEDLRIHSEENSGRALKCTD